MKAVGPEQYGQYKRKIWERSQKIKERVRDIAAAAYKKARILHADSDFGLISSVVDLEEEKILIAHASHKIRTRLSRRG